MLSFLYLISYLQNKRSSNSDTVQRGHRQSLTTRTFGAFVNFIMSIQEKFQAAIKVIQSLPPDGPYQPSNGTKLKFYSLFKQATEGPCKQSTKPGFWDPVGRVKWESWNRLGDISSEEAMITYIDELKKVCLSQVSIRIPANLNEVDKIVETMSFNGDVQDFLESIGPFYEFISLNSPDLDNIKEVVDKYTSSSSSSNSVTSSSEVPSPNNSLPSSPESTPHDTPVKEPLQAISPPPPSETIIVTETTKTNHTHSNGHIPNHNNNNNNSNKNQNHLDTFQLTSSMIPPPSPMHRRSISRGSSIDDQLENEDDETIEVNLNNVITTVSHPTPSVESSDQEYYSGDSEVEDQTDMILMKPIVPTITYTASSTTTTDNEKSKENEHLVKKGGGTVRKPKTKDVTANNVTKSFDEQGYVVVQHPNKVDSVAILQGTIDRLNRDVDHVLARLRILEAAYAANPSGSPTMLNNSNQNNKNRRVRPFRELSTTTWALIFTWPIAVHFLIKLISWWIEQRRRNRSLPRLSLR